MWLQPEGVGDAWPRPAPEPVRADRAEVVDRDDEPADEPEKESE